MAYSLQNPKPNSLLEFVSLRPQFLPAEALVRLQEGLNSGKTKLEDLWLLKDHKKTWAAFSLVMTGTTRRCLMRCELDIPDDALKMLLKWLWQKAIADGVEQVVHFSSLTSRDVTDIVLREGWRLEHRAVCHRTSLVLRTDLIADVAAQEFALDELNSVRFLEFYEPIWQIEPEHFSESAQEIIAEIFERYLNFENAVGYYLFDQNKPVAAGLLRTTRDGVTIDMLGVTPNFRRLGWGNRLHRQLLFAAKNLADIHFGGTDFENVAMRRLLEKNGCEITEEQWAFTNS